MVSSTKKMVAWIASKTIAKFGTFLPIGIYSALLQKTNINAILWAFTPALYSKFVWDKVHSN